MLCTHPAISHIDNKIYAYEFVSVASNKVLLELLDGIFNERFLKIKTLAK